MGRYLNFIACLTALTLFSVGTATAPAQAQMRSNAAQAYPVLSVNTPLARDEETFETDKILNTVCRKTGQESSVCLCITHILKYEMTLSEYQIVTRLYGQPQNRSTLYETLKNEGFKPSEIGTAEEMERSVTQDVDFALRCSEAKAYYKTSRN